MSFRLIDPYRQHTKLTEREQTAMEYLVKYHREMRKEMLLETFATHEFTSDTNTQYRDSEDYFEERSRVRTEMEQEHTGSRTVRDYEKDHIRKMRLEYVESMSRNEEMVEVRERFISSEGCSVASNISISISND